MSRSTQFIGLTARGDEFVSGLEVAPSDQHTTGMFDEMIPLRRWKIPEGVPFETQKHLFPEHLVKSKKAKFVQEVVQEVPWSSGPMIFTRLEIEFHQSDGQVFTASCFEWVHDPNVECEFSYENGTFWV